MSGKIRVGNAPVSFGIFEPEFGETKQLAPEVVLAGIAHAGYQGTELGPYGYLPTDAGALGALLDKYQLGLGSSYIPIAFADEASVEQGWLKVKEVADLLHRFGVQEVIVADCGDERRRAEAGMNPAGFDDAQWGQAIETLTCIARRLKDALSMRLVVHHHVGTYIETPEEIERLLACTDRGEVDLLLDTGHYVYGGGDCLALLERYADRVRYLHYKDIDRDKLERVRAERIHMQRAWRENIFVPLGEGCIDFAAITERLRETNYSGWVIVEQDIVANDDGSFVLDPFACAKESRAYLEQLGI